MNSDARRKMALRDSNWELGQMAASLILKKGER
jgi:hypothetical protein